MAHMTRNQDGLRVIDFGWASKGGESVWVAEDFSERLRAAMASSAGTGCEERFDVLRKKDGAPAHRTETRSACHKKGEWHAAAHAWVHLPDGKILMQLRSMEKDVCPGYWDVAVGGHLSAGEGPGDALPRETFEELGLDPSGLDFRKEGVRKVDIQAPGVTNREFMHEYSLPYAGRVSDLRAEPGQVDEIRAFSPEELLNMAGDPRAKLIVPDMVRDVVLALLARRG